MSEESPFIDFILMGTYLEETEKRKKKQKQNFVKWDIYAKYNSPFAM